MKYFSISLLILPFFLGVSVFGEVPAFKNYVNDLADIVSAPTEKNLNQKLAAFEKQTGNQLAVLTIPSLEGENLEAYANAVFNEWKIGQKTHNNGVLLLIAKSDRKLRIEVGYGLEHLLSDGEAGRIIRRVITPQFKQGNFDLGITQGIQSIQDEVQGYIGIPEKESNYEPPFLLLFIVFLALVVLLVVLWKRYRRYRPRVSEKTGQKMFRLSEKEEDVFLTEAEQYEERIGSVDYDVWVTADRGDCEVIAYNKAFSPYDVCPKCNTKAFGVSHRKVITRPTYYRRGKGILTKSCSYCKHSEEEYYSIQKKVKRRPRSHMRGGSGSSIGGGFSGGGFSGGGGGFSGGGGSSGSW